MSLHNQEYPWPKRIRSREYQVIRFIKRGRQWFGGHWNSEQKQQSIPQFSQPQFWGIRKYLHDEDMEDYDFNQKEMKKMKKNLLEYDEKDELVVTGLDKYADLNIEEATRVNYYTLNLFY